jgi:glycosyltransferase involved in cell wall biosynthesis
MCREMARMGHDITVYTTNVDGPDSLPSRYGPNTRLDGITVRYFECGIGRRLFRSPELLATLKEDIYRYDVLHVHSVFLWPTWKAARLAQQYKIPYVVSPRGMLVRELVRRKGRIRKNFWIGAVEKRTLAGAAFVHVTSDLEKLKLREFNFPINKVEIIPNGVDMPMRPANIDISCTKMPPVILYLGRLNWKKGLDRLIESIPHIEHECRVVFAGGDDEEYGKTLLDIANRIGVADRIEFVGEVDDNMKWKLYSESSVVALVSYQENFGNVVLEALAMAKPVVVTGDVGAAEIVSEFNAGFVVNGEPIEIAEAFDKLLSDSNLCNEMGARGRDAAVNCYSWNKIARNMAEKYMGIISESKQI